MKPTEDTGYLHVFDSDPDDNSTLRRMRATPPSGDLGNAFLKIPTAYPIQGDREPVYVVHEVRASWAGVNRRVLGVFHSRNDAERTAAEAQSSIVSFLRRYNGVPHDRESSGGTVLEYWNAGNPITILGFAVEIETADLS